MPTYQEQRHLPYSADQIFNLVADVEHYPAFLPWVLEARIIAKSENAFTADLDIGYKFIRETYRSEVILTPHKRIDIRYISGPFHHLTNYWIFTPCADSAEIQKTYQDVTQDATKGVNVDFYIDFAFKSSIFQSLMQTLFSEIVQRMIRSFEKRADHLYASSHHQHKEKQKCNVH